jgi:hypothetical protein
MKTICNVDRNYFRPTRLTCNASMSWGAPADDIGSDTYGSSLVNSILTAGTSIANTEILSQRPPNPILGYPYAPPSSIQYGGTAMPFSVGGSSSGSSGMLIIFVAVIAALFLFLKK